MNTNQKPKLLVLRGLIASGKSTYARELVKKGWKRVNKDDLRALIDDAKWSRENEKIILEAEQNLVCKLLNDGLNVVVDDTNFGHEERWKIIAENCFADFEIKDFDTPLTECVIRDAARGDKAIGHKHITRMYEKYAKPKPIAWSEDKQNCYIFDIDGTLAHTIGRSPYDYSLVHTDVVSHNVAMILRTLKASGLPILIVSGRTDDCKEQTMQWLATHNIPHDGLFMRKAGDDRKDSIIKREIYEEHIKDFYNVLGVFDDRNQVVDMWRSLGILCLQVGYGWF